MSGKGITIRKFRKLVIDSRWHFMAQCDEWPGNHPLAEMKGMVRDDEPICEKCRLIYRDRAQRQVAAIELRNAALAASIGR